MKSWHNIIIGTFCGLLIAGVIFFLIAYEKGTPIELYMQPEESSSDSKSPEISKLTITIHISGEVKKPGVYELPVGSRLQDAIQIAGGLTELTDPAMLNLASLLEDGSRKYIPPTKIETVSRSSVDFQDGSLININNADMDSLISLPGIGEVKAKAIIDFRNQNGLFTNLEELLNVPGIGESILASIKDFITLGP